MKKIAILSMILTLMFVSRAFAAGNIFLKVQSVIPHTKIKTVETSPVPGIYTAVLYNNQIIYVAPKEGIILFGSMYTKTGKDLTYLQMTNLQEKQSQKLLKTINLKKAIKIGRGPVKVIEFLDPDCPFCRLSMKLFAKPELAKRMTRYIFLIPQPTIHPHSFAMAEFILNHKNKAKWLNKVMTGSLAKVRYDKIKASKEALNLINYDMNTAKRFGIYGVPYFVIGRSVVLGLNVQTIYKDLGLKKSINVNKIQGN